MEKRIPALDGLRAIAILGVLLTHIWATPGFRILGKLVHAGWAGVDLFFVLSGFLITGVLLHSREEDSRYYLNFYGRRALRIWPVFYLVMFVVFVLWPSSALLKEPREHWPYYVLFASNVAIAMSGKWVLLTDITWSLAIEEQFYFFWPTVVKHAQRLAWICVGIIVGAPLLRAVAHGHLSSTAIHVLTPFRIDEFAEGGLICVVMRKQLLTAEQLRRIGIALVGIAGPMFLVNSALTDDTSWYFDVINYSVIGAACSGLLLLAIYSRRVEAILTRPVLLHIGMVSYGMYLYHWIVQIVVSKLFELMHIHFSSAFRMSTVMFVSVTLVTVAVATVSYRYLEKPILRLKKHFSSSKSMPYLDDALKATG